MTGKLSLALSVGAVFMFHIGAHKATHPSYWCTGTHVAHCQATHTSSSGNGNASGRG